MEEQLVRFIAENLVNEPEKVSVNCREAGRTTILELSVAPSDMGRVIGKNGRVANAIRALLRTAAEQTSNQRIVLEIE